MYAVLQGARHGFAGTSLPSFVVAAVLIVVGALTYVGASCVTNAAEARNFWRTMRDILGARGRPA
jgi:hypothetical protein